jgi:hypothetical protein
MLSGRTSSKRPARVGSQREGTSGKKSHGTHIEALFGQDTSRAVVEPRIEPVGATVDCESARARSGQDGRGGQGRAALVDDGLEADDCKLAGGDCSSCDQAEDDCPEEGLYGLDRLEGECKWGVGIVEPRRRGGGHGGLSIPSGASGVAQQWIWMGSPTGSALMLSASSPCRGLSDCSR